jgi:MFS family permease
VTTVKEHFRLRHLLYPVFLPSFLFSIGESGLIPIIPASAEAMGANIPTAGIIAGLGMLGTLLADIPAVKLINWLGERKAMIYAAFAGGISILLAVFASNIFMLSAGILVSGACMAVFGLARHGFLTEAVPIERRARALAFLGGTFRGGSFVGPLLGSLVIQLWGLHSVYWMTVLFAGLAGLVLLTTKPDQMKNTPPNKGHKLWHIAKREKVKLRTLGLSATALSISRTARTVGLPLWALYIHLPVGTAALYIGIAGALDFALFYTSGQVIDRFGRKWAAAPTLLGMALSFFAFNLVHDATGFFVIAIALSLSNALGSGLVMVIGADLAPKDARNEFLAFFRLMNDSGQAATAPAISLLTVIFGLPLAMAGIGVVALGGAIGMWRHISRFEIN